MKKKILPQKKKETPLMKYNLSGEHGVLTYNEIEIKYTCIRVDSSVGTRMLHYYCSISIKN